MRAEPSRRRRAAVFVAAALLATTGTAAASTTEPAPTGSEPIGLVRRSDAAFAGYTLYAPLNTSDTYLVDLDGTVVHEWSGTHRPGNGVSLLPSGRLLRTEKSPRAVFRSGRGRGGIIEEVGWDGAVRWRFDYASSRFLQHHDVEPLPNGNVLLIAWEKHSNEEAIARGRDPALLTSTAFWSERIVEVDRRTRKVVWMWRAWDHLVQDVDPDKPDYGVVAESPGRVDINFVGGPRDWLHANSIAYNEARDEILISLRRPSEIWVIDHSVDTKEARGVAGDLRFRWGNPQVYQQGDAQDRQLFDQHDAEWIPDGRPGAGNILVFNNGDVGVREYSSVDEIRPSTRGSVYERDADGRFLPEALARVHPIADADRWWSPAISGAQRLPNGNTMIVDGPVGRIFEIAPDGMIAWEYVNPFFPENATPGTNHRGTEIVQWRVFDAERYALDDPAVARVTRRRR